MRLCALCASAFIFSCRSGAPPEPEQKGEATPRGSAATVVGEGPNGARLADPLDAVRARGPLHAEPVHIDATDAAPERWLAVIGNPEMARAAWVVTPGSGELHPVDDWPVGVRVVGSVVRRSVPYLLLESVAVLDQPAGMRAVWSESLGNPTPLALSPPAALDGVADVDDLERRLDALGEDAPAAEPPAGALAWTLKNALRSDAALAAAVSREGVEFVERWQGVFARSEGIVGEERARLALRAAATDAIAQEGCEGSGCEAWTPRGRVALGFAAERDATPAAKERWVVRRIERDAKMAEIDHTKSTPHAVPPSASTALTRQVLREQARTTRAVLGEAPLVLDRAPSSIGLALTDAPDGPLTLVVRDGDYARAFAVEALASLAAESDEEPRFDARFADLDADGRTDVVVRASARASLGVDESVQVALMAPPASVQPDSIEPDLATALAMVDAPTLDLAVEAALDVPRRAVPKEEVCKMLGTVRWPSALEDFRAMSSLDAKVLFFEDPALPTWRARVIPVSKLTAAQVREVWGRDVNPYWAEQHCKELRCDDARPLCRYVDGSLYAAYWFAWKKDGSLVLAGAAFLL